MNAHVLTGRYAKYIKTETSTKARQGTCHCVLSKRPCRDFVLKSNKQNEGRNEKGLIMKNVQNHPEKIERLNSMDIKFLLVLSLQD